MLRDLFRILRHRDPNEELEADFHRMLALATELVAGASEAVWGPPPTDAKRREIYDTDVTVNQLQRAIRKRLVTRLSVGATHEAGRLLVLMSLTKDIERIGDYAKNLLDVARLLSHPAPDCREAEEAQQIRTAVESILASAGSVLTESDTERAHALTETGRDLSRRCDALIDRIAASSLSARDAVALALAARFYKRIQGHVLNLLSSLTMPLHKLDYFDEDLLPDRRRKIG